MLMAASYSIIAEDEAAILDAYTVIQLGVDPSSVAVDVGEISPLLSVQPGPSSLGIKAGPTRTALLGTEAVPIGTADSYVTTLPRFAHAAMSAGRLVSGSLDLDHFDFFEASTYVVLHTGLNIFVLIVASLALTGLAFTVYVVCLFDPNYVYVFIFIKVLLALIYYARPCVNALQRACWKRSRTCTKVVFGGGFFETHFLDRFIVFGRLTLMFDVVLGVFLGPLIGGVAAVSRAAMGIIWGAFRVALLAQPVLPPVIANFDAGFAAYGGVMKARHAALLDPEYIPSMY